MIAQHDPTNANAVPGPSRLPPPPSSASTPAAPASAGALAAPPPSAGATSSLAASSAPTAATRPAQPPRKDPVRLADGPVIVKTVVGPDGVREVPSAFEHCEVDDLITLICTFTSMLDRLIDHNDRIPLTSNSLTRFHSRAPPNISVKDYLVRIARYTNVEPCCLLILLPYVDKVCGRMSTFTISSLTVHRFIIAAISVGSKALSDAFCTNGRYSRVGGVSIVEMNLLEKEFCEALDWRLTTSGPVLAHYYTSLVRSHPNYRLSDAPLPVPPTPPPVDVPPFFSPSPVDHRGLPPVSPAVAFSSFSSSSASAMDVDRRASVTSVTESDAAEPAEPVSADAPVPMSTEPAPVDRRSPSSPPSPPRPPHSQTSSSSVSPSTNSSMSRDSSAAVSLNPSPHASPSRERGRAGAPDGPGVGVGVGGGAVDGTTAPFPPAPPLIPPRLQNNGSASHLPSPARSSHAPPPASAVAASSFPTSPRSGTAAGVLQHALGGRAEGGGPLASPAKRGRGASASSAGSPGKNGAGGGGGEPDPRARFHPSPRLGGKEEGRSAGEVAMALAVNGGGARGGGGGGGGA
ncbi:hypothetical protein JCM8097_009047 [Rhodosporidiobolus ruineniae]